MSSSNFYQTLSVVHDSSQVTDEKNFHSLPSDWLVVLSDVQGSTDAILRGKYKQINAVAVSMIVAVRNCYPDTELPFVFGGDGATICVPPGKETELRE